MGKVIRGCRKGKGSVFKAHTHGRQGAVAMKRADFAERHGYVKGVVKAIVHDSGRGAPLAKIQFKDPYRFKRVDTLVVAPEGMYTGQFIYAGKKGNALFLWSFVSTIVSLFVRCVIQPNLPLEISFLLEISQRVPLFATSRPRLVIVARWPELLVIMLLLSPKMLTRVLLESAFHLDPRSPSPLLAEPWLALLPAVEEPISPS